ncbi:hypothetical protein FE241_20005 [Raoultella terrigena]|nr:hypothetical protein [Raoultella terrigena]
MLFLERQTIGFVKSYKTFTKKIDFRKEARESRGEQIIVLENGRTGERENGRTGERENGRAGVRESGRAGERERRCAGEQESGLDCPGRALAAAREG